MCNSHSCCMGAVGWFYAAAVTAVYHHLVGRHTLLTFTALFGVSAKMGGRIPL